MNQYSNYNNEIVRWVTVKSGAKIPYGKDGKPIKIEKKRDMWGYETELDNKFELNPTELKRLEKMSNEKDFLKEESEKRFLDVMERKERKSKYYNMSGKKYDGGNVDQIMTTGYEDDYYTQIDDNYINRNNVATQKELNNLPVSIVTYSNGERYESTFKNISDLKKGLKQYGGLESYTDGQPYSIMSESGLGEYYLYNDKYYKGGKVWRDSNGVDADETEKADHSRRTKKIEQRDLEFRKYIQDTYGMSYEEWLHNGR